MIDTSAVAAASALYPKPTSFTPTYGTAGFRADASFLASTLFRCGLLAAARALITGRCCGLMITASHNPIQDNGVKLVEPGGEMLPQAWEPLATELAQAGSDEHVAEIMQQIMREHAHAPAAAGHGQPDAATSTSHAAGEHAAAAAVAAAGPQVLIGFDTRPSARALLTAAQAGVVAMGVPLDVAAEPVTTPQLHFMVHARNTRPDRPGPEASLPLYFDTLAGAFEQLVEGLPPPPGPPAVLHVDCANGVGAAHLAALAPRLRAAGLTLQLHNTGSGDDAGGRLNDGCGADYVQKERAAPAGFGGLEPGARCCSVDGDADRLVFFTPLGAAAAADAAPGGRGAPPGVALLDGDKMAALAAAFIRDLLDRLPGSSLDADAAVEATAPSAPSSSEGGASGAAASAPAVRVGVVQTAYANGASTSYITRQLGLPVECTPTGVKHLHDAAHKYDVGVYWEANGHGTVLFSPPLLARLERAAAVAASGGGTSAAGAAAAGGGTAGGPGAASAAAAARELLLLSRVINQTVGDAISGLLLAESVLRRKGWLLSDWGALYTDLPSRQSKLKVSDRAAITTTDAERKCVTPAGLQEAIDAAVAGFPEGSRAFVRPSGTEDAVRVYAEAPTQEQADELALQVARAVYDRAGGVGARP